MDRMEEAVRSVAAAERCVVLTGAGISTESGIPDFRGPQGVWTKDPEAARLSTIQAYLADPEVRRRAWQLRLEHPAWTAKPNEGHLSIARLQRDGLVSLLITQNIDGLHLLAGSPPEETIEIHGSIREVVCLTCGRRAPMREALDRVRAGEDDPPCLDCGGILKSATVSFGQNLDQEDVARAVRGASSCDVFLAVGTSLTVHPVAGFPALAVESGARLILINPQPTPLDHLCHLILRSQAGATLRMIEQGARGHRASG